MTDLKVENKKNEDIIDELKKGKEWKKVKPEFVLEEEFIHLLTKALAYEKREDIKNIDDIEMNFKEKLEKLNSTKFSNKEFGRILTKLKGVNEREAFENLREKHVLERDDGESFYYKLIDFEDVEKNSFEIANQIEMKGRYRNIYDVTILINGLPLVQIELKRSGVNLKDAFNQIKRYRRHSYSGLFNYIQIFIISNESLTKYFANNGSKLNYKFAFHWTDENNKPYLNIIDFSRVFLERSHLLDMFNNSMIHNSSDENIIILRPYQYYASKNVIDMVLSTPYESIEQDDVSNNAFIWHSTGSGKTLTSFKVSQTLSKSKEIDRVIFLVDRKDLDLQTTQEFNKFEKGSVDNTSSTKVLRKQLRDKNNTLILTTIQKMSNVIKKYRADIEHLKDKRVVFIVDECHRSQFGDMHKLIRGFFNKAQFIGFTGTPIFKENANDLAFITSNIFGECIHHYMLKDAISDENVLPFHVEYINTFKKKDNIENVKVSGIDVDEVFKSRERMEVVVDDILIKHNSKTNNRKYNAIFATDSIGSAIEYSKIFKDKMSKMEDEDKLRIATIFSYDDNADFDIKHPREELEELIKDYNKIFATNFSTQNLDGYRHHISKSMKNGDIDILIVVDMFLTGFNAKKLRVLYLDKNLQYHGLLQAFSRTNRVLDNGKTSGIVVSYRNIKKDVHKSLKLFNNDAKLESVFVKDLEDYIEEFKEVLFRLKEVAPSSSNEDLNNLRSEEEQEKFVLNFRELLRLKKAMETFVNFNFNEADLGINENEFSEYQSFYHDLYLKSQNSSNDEVASIISDLEFYTELLDVNKINYDYIKSLLLDIEDDTKTKVINAINRSSDNELHYKKDLILKFLESQSFGASDNPEEDFKSFIENERIREFEEFSKVSGLTVDQLESEVLKISYDPNEEWSKVNRSSIVRKYLKENGASTRIREVRRVVNELDDFLRNAYMKYFYKSDNS